MQTDAEDFRLIARAYSHLCPTVEMIDWAVNRLQEGRDGPAVLELACLDPVGSRYEDTLPLFRRALAEEGIELETQDAAFKAYFRVLMQEISLGNLDPVLGVACVWEEIIAVGLYRAPFAGFHGWYDVSLRKWDHLHGRINPVDSSDIPEGKLPDMIRETAQQELASIDAQ